MLLPKPQQLFPTFPEKNPSEFGPEIEDVESVEAQEKRALDALDVLHFLIVDPLAETHEDEEAEHGVLEVVDDPDGGGT